MGGKMSRNKGQRGERQIIDMLQPIVDEVYAAHLLDAPQLKRNSLQSDRGGSDIAGLGWIALEVKYQETEHLNKWWEQALKQAGKTQEPVLIYRRNRTAWQAMLHGFVGSRSCGQHTPVIVKLEDFLVWFRLRLVHELKGELKNETRC